MPSISLTGSLTAGPLAAISSGAFPSMLAQAAFGLLVEPSSYVSATGVLQFRLDSPSAFVQLGGLDETIGPVKKATLLYLRAPSEIALRITTDDGLGGETVIETPHVGLFVKQWPDGLAVLKIEAKGDCLLEYFLAGPS